MQIQNNMSANNYSGLNFQALKKIKVAGLLENNSVSCENITKALDNNAVFKNFCQKHDVNVIINGRQGAGFIETSLKMIIKNPNKSEFLKQIETIFDASKVIQVSGYVRGGNTAENLKSSLSNLENCISAEGNGVLESYLNHFDYKG